MSIFQHIMLWSLRGLVCWAMIELGFSLHDEVGRQQASWDLVREHRATMERLGRMAQSADARLRQLERQLANQTQGSAKMSKESGATVEEVIATVLTQELEQAGAMQAAAKVKVTKLTADVSRAEVELSWTEAINAVPFSVVGLAGKRPFLSIVRLRYARSDGGDQAHGEASLAFNFEVSEADAR